MIYVYRDTKIDAFESDVTIAVYEHLEYAMSANPGDWVKTGEDFWEKTSNSMYSFESIIECDFGDRI